MVRNVIIAAIVVFAVIGGYNYLSITVGEIEANVARNLNAGSTPRSDLVTVTYKLTGTASGADITYTDGSGNIQQQTGIAVPMTRSSGGAEGLRIRAHRGDFVQILAQNTGASGDLECSIEVDGRVVNTGRSSGGYAIVTCSFSVP